MNCEYFYPKKEFDKNKIDFIYLFFDNGDYLTLKKNEIIDISINLYDKLIWEDNAIRLVAESGFIKLKINYSKQAKYQDAFLYNPKEFIKDRKGYIENRCINEGGIKCVKVFNEYDWHDTIYGNIVAEMDGEYLLLKFKNKQNYGDCSNKNNTIMLNNIKKSEIDSIDLDLENCENFTIYNNEIIDIQLNFNEQLVWDSEDLVRSVRNGFIKLRLDKEISYREVNLFSEKRSKTTIKELEQRLCGEKGFADHDICHLYIKYEYAGYGNTREECIHIEDIRSNEELKKLEVLEEETGYYDYVGGYAKKLIDGTILITFGKDSKVAIDKLASNN